MNREEILNRMKGYECKGQGASIIFFEEGAKMFADELSILIENEKREEVKRFIRYEKANHFTGLLEFLDSDLEKFLEERK